MVRGSVTASLLGRADVAAQRTMVRFGSESKRIVTEHIASGVDARGFVGRVDTGDTKRAIRPGPITRTPRGMRATLEAQPPYDRIAALIEKGRRPNRKVPAKGSPGWLKVRAWVEKHLRNEALAGLRGAVVKIGKNGKPRVGGKRASAVVSVLGKGSAARVAKALDGMTFLVLRAMRKKGTPGLFPFRKAQRALGPGGGLAKIFREELSAARGGR